MQAAAAVFMLVVVCWRPCTNCARRCRRCVWPPSASLVDLAQRSGARLRTARAHVDETRAELEALRQCATDVDARIAACETAVRERLAALDTDERVLDAAATAHQLADVPSLGSECAHTARAGAQWAWAAVKLTPFYWLVRAAPTLFAWTGRLLAAGFVATLLAYAAHTDERHRDLAFVDRVRAFIEHLRNVTDTSV